MLLQLGADVRAAPLQCPIVLCICPILAPGNSFDMLEMQIQSRYHAQPVGGAGHCICRHSQSHVGVRVLAKLSPCSFKRLNRLPGCHAEPQLAAAQRFVASLVRGLAKHGFQPEQQVALLASVNHEVCAQARSALEQCNASHHQQQQAQAQAAEGSFNAFANFDSPSSLDLGCAQDDSQGRLAQLVPLSLIVGQTAAAWVPESGAPQEPAQSRTAVAGMHLLEQQPAGLMLMCVSQNGRVSTGDGSGPESWLQVRSCLRRSAASVLSACSILACAVQAPAVTGGRGTWSSCVADTQDGSQLLAAACSQSDKASRQTRGQQSA